MVSLYVLAPITVFKPSFNSRTFCRNHNRPSQWAHWVPTGCFLFTIQMRINCPLNPLLTFIPCGSMYCHKNMEGTTSVIISKPALLREAPYNHNDCPPSLLIPLLPEVCQCSLCCCLLRSTSGRLAADGGSYCAIDSAGALPLGTRGFRQEKELDIKALPISPCDLFKFVGRTDSALYRTQISTKTSCLCYEPHYWAAPE